MSFIDRYLALVPAGCYANGEEWNITYTDKNGVLVRSEGEAFTHPTHGVIGCVETIFHDDEFVSMQFVHYDPKFSAEVFGLSL